MQLTLPIYFEKKGKQVLCSMNWYRNAHHFEQNKVKKIYQKIARDRLMLAGLKSYCNISINYRLYYKTSNTDLLNVCTIIDKFVADELQNLGAIKNDNVLNYKKAIFEVAGQDKENPRLEILIEEA